VKRRYIIPGAIAAAAIYFALFGGEYGFFALRRLEHQQVREEAAVQALRAEVDSLRARQDSLENNPATLERIARERYGLVGKGERLYRFTEAAPTSDSSGRAER
jgi:cell division protein FtsB